MASCEQSAWRDGLIGLKARTNWDRRLPESTALPISQKSSQISLVEVTCAFESKISLLDTEQMTKKTEVKPKKKKQWVKSEIVDLGLGPSDSATSTGTTVDLFLGSES